MGGGGGGHQSVRETTDIMTQNEKIGKMYQVIPLFTDLRKFVPKIVLLLLKNRNDLFSV